MAKEFIKTFSESDVLESPFTLSGEDLIHPSALHIINQAESIPVTVGAGTGICTVTSVGHGLSDGDLLAFYTDVTRTAIVFSGVPADQDTITINGNIYEFDDNATFPEAGGDTQVDVSAASTAADAAAALAGAVNGVEGAGTAEAIEDTVIVPFEGITFSSSAITLAEGSEGFTHAVRVRRIIDDDTFEVNTSVDLSTATNAFKGAIWFSTMVILYHGAGLDANTAVDVTYDHPESTIKTVAKAQTNADGVLSFAGATFRTNFVLPSDTLGTLEIGGLSQGRIVYEIKTTVQYNK